MARIYKFELPYVVSNWQLGFLVGQLQSMDVWKNLPEELTLKIASCRGEGSDLQILQEDLDLIDDADWTAIAEQVNLEWEYSEDEESDDE